MAIRNFTKQNAEYAERREQMVRSQLGIDRQTRQLVIKGLAVEKLLGAPVLLHERWWRYQRNSKHALVWQFKFEDVGGLQWSAKCIHLRNADHGWLLHLTHFYALKPL